MAALKQTEIRSGPASQESVLSRDEGWKMALKIYENTASQPASQLLYIHSGRTQNRRFWREKKTGFSREGLNFPYPFGNLLLWYGACFRVNVLSCSQNALVCALRVVEFWHLLHVAGWRIWICFGVFTGLKSATPFLCCGQDFAEGVFFGTELNIFDWHLFRCSVR